MLLLVVVADRAAAVVTGRRLAAEVQRAEHLSGRPPLAEPIPLPPLPFNVSLADARFEPDGLHLAATARDSRFPVR